MFVKNIHAIVAFAIVKIKEKIIENNNKGIENAIINSIPKAFIKAPCPRLAWDTYRWYPMNGIWLIDGIQMEGNSLMREIENKHKMPHNNSYDGMVDCAAIGAKIIILKKKRFFSSDTYIVDDAVEVGN